MRDGNPQLFLKYKLRKEIIWSETKEFIWKESTTYPNSPIVNSCNRQTPIGNQDNQKIKKRNESNSSIPINTLQNFSQGVIKRFKAKTKLTRSQISVQNSYFIGLRNFTQAILRNPCSGIHRLPSLSFPRQFINSKTTSPLAPWRKT